MNPLHDKPIDGNALRVIKRGEHWEPEKRPNVKEFDVRPAGVPLPTKPTWNGVSMQQPPTNLIGRKVGRMTVIGYAGKNSAKTTGGKKKSGQEAHRWICRCPCGRYTIRTGITILRAKDADDKCEHCRHLAHLRREDRIKQGIKK